MARIRTIKPEFWTDEKIVSLSFGARLLFLGLLNFCDDEGYIEYEPVRIRLQIFPADNVDCKKLMGELLNTRLLERIDLENGKCFLRVMNFLKHQVINRPSKTKLINAITDLSLAEENTHGVLTEHSLTERKGKERKGKEIENTNVFSCRENLDDSPKNSEFKKTARNILDFLNKKTGRHYRPVDTNLKLIIARLKSGATEDDCRCVIAKKSREWASDAKMEMYLRPATLFNATKFEQYVGELILDDSDKQGGK